MTRVKNMRESPLKPKREPPAISESAWRLQFSYCFATKVRDYSLGVFHLHHICGRKGKNHHHPCNWVMLSGAVHQAFHDQNNVTIDGETMKPLTLPQILGLKLAEDPRNWNYDLLEGIHGQSLPYPEPLSEFYLLRRRA